MVTNNFFPASPILSQVDKDCGHGKSTRGKDILQFIVHDTGIGTSEEQQQYIYKQLNGLDSSTITIVNSGDLVLGTMERRRHQLLIN